MEVVANPSSQIPLGNLIRPSWRGGRQVVSVMPEKDDPASTYVIIADVRCCIKPLKQSAKWANGFPPSEVTFAVYNKNNYSKLLYSTHVVYDVNIRDEIGGLKEILSLAAPEMADIPRQVVGGAAAKGELSVRQPQSFLNAFSEVFKHIGTDTAHFIVPDLYSRNGLIQLFTWAVRKCGCNLPRYFVEMYAELPGVTPITGDVVEARCRVHTGPGGAACGKRCTKAYVHELHAEFLKAFAGEEGEEGGESGDSDALGHPSPEGGCYEVVAAMAAVEDEVLNPDASDEDALED